MSTAGSGLNNMGNTCFFNAVLQCILHSAPLARLLEQKTHEKQCANHGWCVYCELGRVWARTRNQRVVEPSGLVHNLNKLFKKVSVRRFSSDLDDRRMPMSSSGTSLRDSRRLT
jgi:uncharacterized UBP type Zn finger protein